ncbi:unnamed protein product [Calypogeia fissa]
MAPGTQGWKLLAVNATFEERSQSPEAEEISPADGGLEVQTGDLSNRQLRERGLEIAQRTVAHWKSRVERGKVNRAQHTFTSEERDGKNFSTTSEDSIPNNYLRELLLAKDGEFGLQPIVMAGFYMNVNVMVLLGYAYGKCASDLLGWDQNIRRDPPGPLVYVEDKAHRDNRARLRLVTEKFIAKLGKAHMDNSAQPGSVPEPGINRTTREACKERFRQDPDFNFLPIEEYFFHFICGTEYGGFHGKDIIKEFWKEIRSFPGELWRFLLELKDGQGRTPIHAAINGWAVGVESLLRILISDGKDDAGEVIVCALTTPDAATRMPAHTAAVQYGGRDLKAVLTYARQYNEVSVSCRCTQQMATFVRSAEQRKILRQSHPSQSEKFYVFCDYALFVLSKCVREIPIWERHVGEGQFRGDFWQKSEFWLQRSCTPFHAAVLTRSYRCAKLLIEASDELQMG